jgi:hypothetical protein
VTAEVIQLVASHSRDPGSSPWKYILTNVSYSLYASYFLDKWSSLYQSHCNRIWVKQRSKYVCSHFPTAWCISLFQKIEHFIISTIPINMYIYNISHINITFWYSQIITLVNTIFYYFFYVTLYYMFRPCMVILRYFFLCTITLIVKSAFPTLASVYI